MLFIKTHTLLFRIAAAACWFQPAITLAAQTAERYPVLPHRDVVIGGPKSDKALDVFQTGSGHYVLVGETKNTRDGGKKDALLLKVDENLKEEFRRPFGNPGSDAACAALEAHDGAYVLAGYGVPGRKSGWGGTDAWLLKTNESGVPIWSYYFGAEGEDIFRDIVQLDDGRFVVTGSKDNHCWIACIDRNGNNIEWEFLLPGTEPSEGVGLTRTRDKQIVVTGFIEKPRTPTRAAVLLIKLTESGSIVFQKEINTNDAARGMQVIELEDGSLGIAGVAYSANYRDDMCLLVTNANGELLFDPRPYGDTGNDRAYAIVQEWDGNLLLSGATMSHTENAKRSNLWIRKISPENGDSQWRKNAKEDLGYLQNDACNALLINHQGYPLSAGFSNRPGKGDDVWLLQFDNSPVQKGVQPEQLVVEDAQFYEWEQNGEINPEERCYLGFYLRNAGRESIQGLFTGIRKITGDTGIVFPEAVLLPGIHPDQKVFVSIPLSGSAYLAPGVHLFELVIRDALRQELAKFNLEVKSNNRPEPEIRVSDARFIAAQNGIARRGETLQFQFDLENAGNRTADKVEINLSVSGNIPLKTSLPPAQDLVPYSRKKVNFSFTVPNSYPSDTLTVYCSAADEQLKYIASAQYTLVLDEPLFILPDSLREPGLRAVVWKPDFMKLADSTLHKKQITAKAVVISDQPVSPDQIILIRNQTDAFPLQPSGRLVLLQSEEGVFVYHIYLPLSMQIGTNDLQIQYRHDKGMSNSSRLTFKFEAPQPHLFLYSIGVPLQEEGQQYNVQNAGDFYNFVLQNKNQDYFSSIDARLITDTAQTEFYKLRKLLFEIRDRAKQGQYQPEDVLLIYISAQATDKVKGTFKIKASDYDGVEVETSAVDFEDFFLYFLDDPAIKCHKVLLLDVFGEPLAASAADADTEGEGKEEQTLSAVFTGFQGKHKDLISITACSPGEIAREDARWSNSAFIESVVSLAKQENLTRCDTNFDREISLLEFYNFIQQKTPEIAKSAGYSAQTPLLIKGNGNLKDFTLFSY